MKSFDVLKVSKEEPTLGRSFTTVLSLPAIRRAIAAVCAVAFLVVGFTHSLHDFDSTTPVPQQIAAGAPDPSPEPANKATVAIGHCHACTMVAITVAAPIVPSDPIALERPSLGLSGIRPFSPFTETPPPKTAA